jgi:uncharacterized protein (TIGR02284 family)
MKKEDTTNNDTIKILNDLIGTCVNGEEGFRACSEHASSSALKTLFSDRAERCKHSVTELQALVRGMGGKPADAATVAGALHRGWINVRLAIAGNEDEVILNECERGEDVAIKEYRSALEEALPINVRTVVSTQYGGAMLNHEMVRNLREKYSVHI